MPRAGRGGRQENGGGAAPEGRGNDAPRGAHSPQRGRPHSPQHETARERARNPALQKVERDGENGQTGALWQWRHGDTWVAYESAHSATIERYFKARHVFCPLGQWEIVFSSMRQYVTGDRSRSRAVRRIELDGQGRQTERDRGVQIWNHAAVEVDVRATLFSAWSAKLNPAASKGSWHGCSFPENEVLQFCERGSGVVVGEWAVTAHKIQQLFCELDPRTGRITVRAMVCHESDPTFDRYVLRNTLLFF